MPSTKRRNARWLVVWVLVVAIGGLPASGQTTFNPILRLWSYYTDHVEVVGEAASDSYYRLELELPVRRELRNGYFSFRVAPFFQRFERETVFDNEGFRAGLTLSVQPRPRSSLEISARAVRTQDQPLPRSPDEILLFLTPRAERDFRSAAVSYARRVGELWSWDLRLYASDFRTELIDPPDGETPLLAEDHTQLSFGGGVYRRLSSLASLGLRYRHSRYDLELGGEETNDLLSVNWRRQLSRKWSLDLRVGGYHRSGTASDGTDISGSGPQGEVSLTRVFRRMEIEARAASLVTAGGALLGTSNLELVQLSLLDSRPGRWNWYLFGRLAHRVPSQPGLATVDLETVGAALELRFRRLLGIRLDGFYANQTGDDLLETSLYRVGVSMVVYPLGRTRLARREGDARTGD